MFWLVTLLWMASPFIAQPFHVYTMINEEILDVHLTSQEPMMDQWLKYNITLKDVYYPPRSHRLSTRSLEDDEEWMSNIHSILRDSSFDKFTIRKSHARKHKIREHAPVRKYFEKEMVYTAMIQLTLTPGKSIILFSIPVPLGHDIELVSSHIDTMNKIFRGYTRVTMKKGVLFFLFVTIVSAANQWEGDIYSFIQDGHFNVKIINKGHLNARLAQWSATIKNAPSSLYRRPLKYNDQEFNLEQLKNEQEFNNAIHVALNHPGELDDEQVFEPEKKYSDNYQETLEPGQSVIVLKLPIPTGQEWTLSNANVVLTERTWIDNLVDGMMAVGAMDV